MRRVLVARLDSLGDVLLTGPAVRAVAASGAEVTMLSGPQGAAAARMLPGVHRVEQWASPWIVKPAPEATAEHVAALAAIVERVAPDEAIILTSFHQSPLPLALLLRLSGVRRITGASVDYPGTLLDVRLRPGEDLDEDQPEAERALAIARAAGYELPADDRGGLRVLGAAATPVSGSYLVVHPGASAPSREWPRAHHAEAVRRLTERGHRVVVTGTAGERQLTAAVAGRDGLDLAGRLTLPQLAGLLAGAKAVVTGNTGPAHLAAAVGTPVVSLFSPVVPAVRWAPYAVPHVLLGDQGAGCRGSRATECPVPGHPCLAGVSPAEVVAACEALVAGSRTPLAERVEGGR